MNSTDDFYLLYPIFDHSFLDSKYTPPFPKGANPKAPTQHGIKLKVQDNPILHRDFYLIQVMGWCLFIRRLRRQVIFSNIPILMADVGQENSIKHSHSETRMTGHSRHCSVAMRKSQRILPHDCILILPPRMFSVGGDTTLQELFFPLYPLWPKLKWTPENVLSCGSSIFLSTRPRGGKAVVVLRVIPSLSQARGS